MVTEGDLAPPVALPGYVDGERTRVDLTEYIGEEIVVLVFYPGDFNPGCSAQEADISDLDLFTMQKDVDVFGVSPDSTYSHEAFADRYSLRMPLLSDTETAAADAYDVELDTAVGEQVCQRAVFVVDHRGTVTYAWATDDLAERVDVDPVKQAVEAITSDETAVERYRSGSERYVAGREALSAAMTAYENRDWPVAQRGFREAEPAFADAADQFDSAVRFAETAEFETVVDRVEERADGLQRAADWLAKSADALANGRGAEGTEYRDDAERSLSSVSDLPEPPDSDAVTLTASGVSLDEAVVDAAGIDGRTADGEGSGTDDGIRSDLEMDLDTIEDEETRGSTSESDGVDSAADDGGKKAEGESKSESEGEDKQGDEGENADDEVIETLDLTDPTEDESDDETQPDWDVPGQ